LGRTVGEVCASIEGQSGRSDEQVRDMRGEVKKKRKALERREL
jgi:hypothetical protein